MQWPAHAKKWDWTETGTEHQPGTQPADIAEMISGDAVDVMVLSKGMRSVLGMFSVLWGLVDVFLLGFVGVCDETLKLLATKKIATHVLPTQQAVELYNKLNDGAHVHVFGCGVCLCCCSSASVHLGCGLCREDACRWCVSLYVLMQRATLESMNCNLNERCAVPELCVSSDCVSVRFDRDWIQSLKD